MLWRYWFCGVLIHNKSVLTQKTENIPSPVGCPTIHCSKVRLMIVVSMREIMSHLFRYKAALLLTLVLSQTGWAQQDEPAAQQRPADVRLVIDVSGSMKRNDPNNLRQPAVELLVQLLPENSKAGVWTFGQWVNMLVPHRQVGDEWRSEATKDSEKINSVGLYTNIGGALEKATYDSAKKSDNYRTSIILLTDGMVDIDKDPQKNRQEWRRIADEVLPKLKDAGYTIHTIALSDNADTDLMNKLSLSTDGIAAVAHTADDLMKIFLKAFDVSAPAEQVPLSDNSFVIDSSVEEFTALIFRKNPKESIELIGPDKETYKAGSRSRYVNWYRADNYDLVTMKQPLEGEWLVVGEMDPDSRVTVVSNLNLRVKPLPNNVYKGEKLKADFWLQEDGKTITRADFLSLMDIESKMMGGNDEFDLKEFWSEPQDTSSPPSNGVFANTIPAFDKDGIYQLTIQVDGKSFIREFSHQFTVRQPFGAEIKQQFNEGRLEYVLSATSYGGDVDFSETQVVATVINPERRKKIRPLSATGLDSWQTTIIPDIEGQYRADIKVKGLNKDGSSINVTLEPIIFNYSIDEGFVEKEEPFFEATPEPTPEPTKVPEPEATQAPVTEEETAETTEEAPVVEDKVPAWILYIVLAVGNLLLIGLGYFAYRKIMGGGSEEILEEFSDEAIQQNEEEILSEPEDDEEVEEEEPPMEDLEPVAEDEPEPEMDFPEAPDEPEEMAVEEEPEADDDMEMPSMEDISEDVMDMAADDEPEPEPEVPEAVEEEVDDIAEMAMEAEAEPEEPLGDGFDDLDEMAMEKEAEEAIEEELSQDEEEEDMVAAMLKAQGLDLAEDELDEAISSLIEDLDRDDDD